MIQHIDEHGHAADLVPGVPASGFSERRTCHFTSSITDAVLYIDDAALERVRLPDGRPAWQWTPGFHAGEVAAELVDSRGALLARYRLDVSPDVRKLGRDEFMRMLDDLYDIDPAMALGDEEGTTTAGAEGGLFVLLLAYARLRTHGDALLRALSQVAGIPLTRLCSERMNLPLHRVRRWEGATLRECLRKPQVVAFVSGTSAGSAVPRVDILRSIEHLDNPANRTLLASVLAVRRQCLQVAGRLAAILSRHEPGGARSPLWPRIPRKLDHLATLAESLRRLVAQSPFSHVTRAEVSAAGLNAVSAHPDYARAHRLARCALRSGAGGEDRADRAWTSPTWEIYERWCFIRLVEAARQVFGEGKWHRGTPGANRWCARSGDDVLEIWYQKTFSADNGEADPCEFHSITAMRIPDLLVTLDSAGHRRMLVLDAKYRVSRENVLDATASAHIYQDSLRWRGERPTASLLLVPDVIDVQWLADEVFQRRHRVGVVAVNVSSASCALEDVLSRWLGKAMTA